MRAQAAERVKLSTLVEFPTRGLDMSPFTWDCDAASADPPVYDLYGVINHYGSMGYGHYTAFVRDEVGGGGTSADADAASGVDSSRGGEADAVDAWSEIDDKNCFAVAEDVICSKAAYVLFYRRR
jgi:ubiquitin C-terminal hydrolase